MINKKWFGFFLIILGIGFLLQQLDILGFADLLATWWAIIVIIIGIIQLITNPQGTKLSR